MLREGNRSGRFFYIKVSQNKVNLLFLPGIELLAGCAVGNLIACSLPARKTMTFKAPQNDDV